MHVVVSVCGCTQVGLQLGCILEGGGKATIWPPFLKDKLETDTTI